MDDTVGLRPFLWFTLYELLRLGAGRGSVRVSTIHLAKVMGFSQQSASRHLKLLEEMGLVSRRIDARGSSITITPKGMGKLEEVYCRLEEALKRDRGELVFEGEVFTGLVQGAYYISQPGYRDQIQEKLGFDPFPGTLNLRLLGDHLERRRVLEGWPSVTLEGFRGEDRGFGAAKCYSLMVNGEVEGALIVAERTSYDRGVMEVISPLNLRERFDLEDGDLVKLVFTGQRVPEGC
jgi:riboflavin kinase